MIFKEGKRQNELRNMILEYFISFLMTDDERADLNGLPEGCRMRENAKIYSPEKLQCGKHVWIGENAKLDASGGLHIGDHTSIGLNVDIWSHTSYLANLTFSNHPKSSLIEHNLTKIGSGCFIAGPSVIYPGVHIGDRVVVLPMSVVSKDIPSNSIAGGCPAKVIRKITDDFINEKLKNVKEKAS